VAVLLGIDTGGTYTDAVLFDEMQGVLATGKALTTKHDLSIGVRGAVARVCAAAPEAADAIRMVSLSTTLATNSLVEGQGNPVGLILIGFDRKSLERADLGAALAGDPVAFIAGGHGPLGEPQAPLDLAAARAAIEEQGGRVSAFAVAAYFSVRNPAHEIAVRDLAREMTGLPVTCAHELSPNLNAPRRALTALLNARLIALIQHLILAVRGFLDDRGLRVPLMVVKGDGSLVSDDTALARPVETILSGPAASVVGARYLTGGSNVFVSDIGGTTTDIALLRDGRPVLDRRGATVGGWRTMVEAVAVHTFGLGGDSEVRPEGPDKLQLGPRRVIPLSLLATEQPAILAVLEAQAERPEPRSTDARFALRLREPPGGPVGLTPSERRLWERLADGVAPLEALIKSSAMEPPLDRLVRRGLVVLSGFTPSDAAHVLGRQHTWSGEAARLGALLTARAADPLGRLGPADPAAFSARVHEETVVRSAVTVLTTALAEDGGPAAQADDRLGPALIERALRRPEAEGSLLGVEVRLKRPLVAIGAPAATYYPEVARRLNTALSVPPHAAVCNAVGAVASGVLQSVTGIITLPEEGRYRVHLPSGVHDFATLQEAAAHAEAEAGRLAEERARAAGSETPRLSLDRKDNIVRAADGTTTFIESRITATAAGRPRLAAE